MERKMKITEKKYDIITGKETVIEREETAQEIAEREELQTKLALKTQAEAEAATKRRTALTKLEALGLDEADLTALGL